MTQPQYQQKEREKEKQFGFHHYFLSCSVDIQYKSKIIFLQGNIGKTVAKTGVLCYSTPGTLLLYFKGVMA